MIIEAMPTSRTTLAALAAILLSASALAQSQPAKPAPRQIPAPPDVKAPPADATKTANGLASKVITPGKEPTRAKAGDIVTVHYTGWTTDGKMFDSSHARNAPSTFPLERVLPGWRECVMLMTVGETRRCWVPEALGYKGAAGRPKGMLVFEVELLGVKASPTAAPPDVAGPPSDAKRTASGLAYKVLKPGTGGPRPMSRSRVTVHYTGWTTDGKMFDSSVARGKPATFGLGDVIKGWTEGVQLMTVGETTRFWIPQELAYQGQAGAPRGMLVFDIELIEIDR
jgi:peptidylprolyl isomerase